MVAFLFHRELDYTQTPPAQELKARDLHDQEWHFRHIYRGQPRRHLLTTGWSVFVSAKRLQVGDTILFIRDDKGRESFDKIGNKRSCRLQCCLVTGVLAAANHAAATSSRFTIFYNPRLITFTRANLMRHLTLRNPDYETYNGLIRHAERMHLLSNNSLQADTLQ